MRCRECEGLLWSYLDGELAGEQSDAVSVHLASCPRCSLTHERLRAFPLPPGRLPTVAPPPDFTARLMQRIAPLPPPAELAAQLDQEQHGALAGWTGRTVAVAAAAATLLVGLVSTSILALLSGQIPSFTGAGPGQTTTNAIGVWFATEVTTMFSWPVLAALLGMQIVLVVLWFRVIVPQPRQAEQTERPLPRRRR